MAKTLYFAYGSNLSQAQMTARVPGSELVGRAILPNHALTFTGFSQGWGGAVANVTRAPGGMVEGVVYQLPRRGLSRLDVFEGHPTAYRRVRCRVLNEFGAWRTAHVYVQPEREEGRPPLPYLSVMLRAYRQHGFDLGPLALAARMATQPWAKKGQLALRGVES